MNVKVCCVCVILCYVLIHSLTHDVHTHICCKITVQSVFITIGCNTFLTFSAVPLRHVWLESPSTVPSRYTICGYFVWWTIHPVLMVGLAVVARFR